ncbi:2-oxoglutarate dehydrogenase E1 component, partial [Linnemannia gamsii]
TKWLQRTGLTMLLPHGYDGQGPEHSSARIERYLQMCDDHPDIFPSPEKMSRQHQDCNIQLVYCSTPANYFHALRRQIHRDYRKPLYPNAEIVWCQEEPLNMGAWAHVGPRIRTSLRETEFHANKEVRYAGREPSASVATGNKKVHLAEEYAFLAEALTGEAKKPSDVIGGVPVF